MIGGVLRCVVARFIAGALFQIADTELVRHRGANVNLWMLPRATWFSFHFVVEGVQTPVWLVNKWTGGGGGTFPRNVNSKNTTCFRRSSVTVVCDTTPTECSSVSWIWQGSVRCGVSLLALWTRFGSRSERWKRGEIRSWHFVSFSFERAHRGLWNWNRFEISAGLSLGWDLVIFWSCQSLLLCDIFYLILYCTISYYCIMLHLRNRSFFSLSVWKIIVSCYIILIVLLIRFHFEK